MVFPAAPSVCILLILSSVVPSLATDYTAGDKQGWNLNVDYAAWAKGKTFKVGDKLVFNYGSSHNVMEVSSTDYNSCSAANAIQSFGSGPTTVNLNKTGSHYFICGVPGHCTGGMKLTVNVGSGAGATPSSPSGSSGGAPPGKNASPAAILSPVFAVFSALVSLCVMVF